MPYVIERVGKRGARYTAVYTDENGRRKSAGTYDTEERAQNVAKQHQSHMRLRLAETSPADKATITVQDFAVKFLREHAVEPNSKMTYAQLLNSHVYPFIGKRRVSEIGRETIHRLLTVVLPEEGASQSTVVEPVPDPPLGHDADGVGSRLSRRQPSQGDQAQASAVRLIVVRPSRSPARLRGAAAPAGEGVRPARGVNWARHCELIPFTPGAFPFRWRHRYIQQVDGEVTATSPQQVPVRPGNTSGDTPTKIDVEVAEWSGSTSP